MKDVRLALLNDLKNDGLVKRNVPFSTARKLEQRTPMNVRNTINTDEVKTQMKDAVKTFIMNNDPSVKKLPSLQGGIASPDQDHISLTSKK